MCMYTYNRTIPKILSWHMLASCFLNPVHMGHAVSLNKPNFEAPSPTACGAQSEFCALELLLEEPSPRTEVRIARHAPAVHPVDLRLCSILVLVAGQTGLPGAEAGTAVASPSSTYAQRILSARLWCRPATPCV